MGFEDRLGSDEVYSDSLRKGRSPKLREEEDEMK